MQIFFRTDASLQIGTGHVMRCLTLADALREGGGQCTFVCREHQGNLLALIEQRGHRAISLPVPAADFHAPTAPEHAAWAGADWSTDAHQTRAVLSGKDVDWLVVDHYALDLRWEAALRPYVKRLMVIDDLADRQHDCDLLLDQNLGRCGQDYNGLIPEHSTRLIGPHYALLRPEFASLREESLARRREPQLRRLLITMGGVDKDNYTGHVLDALRECTLPPELRITVVMGPHAPWLEKVREQAIRMPWPTDVLVGVNNMAQMMVESDFAIGAAGSTSWERCCLGLPTAMLILALNQQDAAKHLQDTGAVRLLEPGLNFQDEVHRLMQDISSSKDILTSLSICAAAVTDGNGVARTICHLA